MMRHMPRRCLLLVLLLLLSLRGWAGAAMATTMAAPQPALPVAASAVMEEDCHSHGQGAHDAVAESSGPSSAQASHGVDHGASHPQGGGGACASCAFCQWCHTVALALPWGGLGADWAPASLPQARLPVDLSATTLPGDKPPIA